jgi:uncharacterized MFS-type transporter C6orf192
MGGELTLSCSSTPLLASCKKEKKVTKIVFDRRQYMTLFALAYGNFCVAACVSLQAPFFPQECDKKGVSPKVYGLIFGIYELVIVSTSPIFGKLVRQPFYY